MVECHGAVDVTQPMSVQGDATAAPQDGRRRPAAAAFVVFRPKHEKKIQNNAEYVDKDVYRCFKKIFWLV